MKRLLIILAALAAAFACSAPAHKVPMSVAHRGAHVDSLIPENSPAAVAMAARMGYTAIECDVHYTRDSVLVIMHDKSINRTMRNKDGYTKIEEPVRYPEHDFQELRDNYVLASTDPEFRKPIPTFEEHLAACKEYGIIPMLHTNETKAYEMAKEVLGDGFIAFDEDYEALKYARSISDCLILWDPGRRPADEVIAKLDSLGGRCGVSSMKADLLTKEFIGAITAAGYEVQSSIFPTPKELQCIADGATIFLSDFGLFPQGKTPVRKNTRKNISLADGESVELSGFADCLEFGCVDLALSFKGAVELTVCGERVYPLQGEGETFRLGGWRFHNAAPSLVVKAVGDAEIVRSDAVIYSF